MGFLGKFGLGKVADANPDVDDPELGAAKVVDASNPTVVSSTGANGKESKAVKKEEVEVIEATADHRMVDPDFTGDIPVLGVERDGALFKESFIPFRYADLKQYLVSDHPQFFPDDMTKADFNLLCDMMVQVNSIRINNDYAGWKEEYTLLFDPDEDLELPANASRPKGREMIESLDAFKGTLVELLADSGFFRVSREVVDHALKKSSGSGLRVEEAPEGTFETEMFCRGIREEEVEEVSWLSCHWGFLCWPKKRRRVDIFKRLIVCFRLRHEVEGNENQEVELSTGVKLQPNWLYMKSFRDFPVDDLDMLLPGATVKFTWLDWALIILPLVFAAGSVVWKLIKGQTVVDFSTSATAMSSLSVIVLPVTWAVKCYLGVQDKQKEYKDALNTMLLTRNMGVNGGVLASLLEEAQEQEDLECVLCYFFLWMGMQQPEPKKREVLDTEIESYLNGYLSKSESIDGRMINFQVSDAVQKLVQCKVISVDDDGDGEPDDPAKLRGQSCRFSRNALLHAESLPIALEGFDNLRSEITAMDCAGVALSIDDHPRPASAAPAGDAGGGGVSMRADKIAGPPPLQGEAPGGARRPSGGLAEGAAGSQVFGDDGVPYAMSRRNVFFALRTALKLHADRVTERYSAKASLGPLKDSMAMGDVRQLLQELVPDLEAREFRHVAAVADLDGAGHLNLSELRAGLKAGNEAWQEVREPDPYVEDIEAAVGVRGVMDVMRAALQGAKAPEHFAAALRATEEPGSPPREAAGRGGPPGSAGRGGAGAGGTGAGAEAVIGPSGQVRFLQLLRAGLLAHELRYMLARVEMWVDREGGWATLEDIRAALDLVSVDADEEGGGSPSPRSRPGSRQRPRTPGGRRSSAGLERSIAGPIDEGEDDHMAKDDPPESRWEELPGAGGGEGGASRPQTAAGGQMDPQIDR